MLDALDISVLMIAFFVGEDHGFCKVTPTNAKLKTTGNKKINGFLAMQWIKSENEVIAVQD